MEQEIITAPAEQQKFPKIFKEQLAAVRDLLRTQGSEWTVDQTTILTCLESLEALGIVTNHTESGDSSRWYLAELQKVVDRLN